MLVHSDGLLVGKKFDIIKPLVGKTWNGLLVSIYFSVLVSVGIVLYRRHLQLYRRHLQASVGKGL